MAIEGISESIVISAPKSVVWSVLADFPNIADWTDSVKTSVQTSDAFNGVGATRSCDLAPMGAIKERIAEWDPENKIVIDIYETAKMPVKSSLTTFSLEEIDATTTRATMSPRPEIGGGIFSGILANRLAKRFPKAVMALLTDLKTASEAKTQAAA